MNLAILASFFLLATLSCALPSPNDWDSGAEVRECTPGQGLDSCHDPKSLPKTGDDESAIVWFGKCIVKYYCFKQGDAKKEEWTAQPNFAGLINTEHFNRAAEVAKKFFLGKTWKGPQGLVPKYLAQKGGHPTGIRKLLHITAARYLYVTYLLFQASEDGIAPCVTERGGEVRIPNGVCFMEPAGSATSTSDYDASLVGPKSGLVTGRFNEMFEDIFHMPSEEVFDTNIYAFSLEYAMPYIYAGLSDEFKRKLREMEADDKYKIQDLVCALYKIRKYDFDDAEDKEKEDKEKEDKEKEEKDKEDKDKEDKDKEDKDTATNKNKEGVEFKQLKKAFTEKFNARYQKLFKSWDFRLDAWLDKNTKDRKDLRKDHNKIYSDVVATVSRESDNEFVASYLTEVMLALMYAAEAYHSRGTMRYIVGWTQLKRQEVKSRLTPLDYWTSMMENWGDTLKEYKHCKAKSEVCLVKMSKYMTRTFNSMVEIRAALAVTDLKPQQRFNVGKTLRASNGGQGHSATRRSQNTRKDTKDLSPAAKITSDWLQNVKKAGKSSIERAKDIGDFFQLFACKDDKKGSEISRGCIDKIFSVIRTYHYKLIESMNKGTI